MTQVRPKKCALCQAEESNGIHFRGQKEVVTIRTDVKIGERQVQLCDTCVKLVINADRRRKYADKHYLSQFEKRIDRFENRPIKHKNLRKMSQRTSANV
jgi:hypothetical protein